VINSPSKIVRLAVNLHEHLVQVPLTVRICAHLADSFFADFCSKQRAKSVPPKSNRFVADVDAAFVQKVLHVPKRKRKPHIHHNSPADDLRARLKIAEEAVFCHPAKIIAGPNRLNRFCSDTAAPWPSSERLHKGVERPDRKRDKTTLAEYGRIPPQKPRRDNDGLRETARPAADGPRL
jgi:hypothetical protein